MSKNDQLRETFNRDAHQYDQARPGYPDKLFEDIVTFSEIPTDGKILEIGCGTGQATIPFAQRGYSIHCIELGENLAEIARKKLIPYPQAQVSIGAFEKLSLVDESFDLAISATAFHWIDPHIGYKKLARVLKPAGAIALFWNKPVQTELSNKFFQSIQDIYMQVVPSMAKKFPGLPHPDEIQLPVKADINKSGKFGKVTVKKYKWDQAYTAPEYTELLDTYSDHITLDTDTKATLFAQIENQIEAQHGGRIVKEHLTILYLAQRK
jgi:ubiquinone/menaquinone biosynthesis C-methylase UbiE